MKTLFILYTALSIFFVTSVNSQVTEQWSVRYNSPFNGYDDATAIITDNYGNVYVTGLSVQGGAADYATMKYSSSGSLLWLVTYNGPGNGIDQSYAIAVDNSGNVYVTGESFGNGTDDDYATIKYNSSGSLVWAVRYNGPGNGSDWAFSLAVDGQGNVYVTGKSFGSGTDADYATIKYNSNGVQQWVSRYNGPGSYIDIANSIKVDNSGNVYVTGVSYGINYNADYATIKYNYLGMQVWAARYNGPGNNYDHARDIEMDYSGFVYVTGESYGSGTGYDYSTIKYDPSSGSQMWVARYNGALNLTDQAYALIVDIYGNVYVTGNSRVNVNSGSDYATLKYSSSGVQQWVSIYNGPASGNDYASSIELDNSGNVYVTGSSTGTGTYDDFTTVKYNSSGVQQWRARKNGTGNGYDFARGIVLDNYDNVYVTGISYGNGTNFDFLTIKYTQGSRLNSVFNSEVPDNFKLHQNFPNPFNPATKIKLELPKESNTKIAVYDVLGNELSVVVDEWLEAGSYEFDWNGSGFSSGTYFYKLMTDEFTETKKMILLK